MTASGDDDGEPPDGERGDSSVTDRSGRFEPDPLDEPGDETLTDTSHPEQPEAPRALPDSEEDSRREAFGSRERQRPPYIGSEDAPRSSSSSGTGTDDSWQSFTRDLLVSVLAVALLGMYLFAVSGVWPPMVAIESESMEPNMNVNDLVFLMDIDRFQPDDAHAETGIVPASVGDETGYENYGDSGDVIVFEPDGNENTTPIIHRAMFWVDEGDNWCEIADETADSSYLGALSPDDDRCIAPNDGFITKGDNNHQYDQASTTQADRPVKPEWVIGTAEVRIPRLGWFRLQFV